MTSNKVKETKHGLMAAHLKGFFKMVLNMVKVVIYLLMELFIQATSSKED